MKKKLLSLLMASVLVFGMSTTAFAAEVITPASAVTIVTDTGATVEATEITVDYASTMGTVEQLMTAFNSGMAGYENYTEYTEVLAAVRVDGMYEYESATLTFNLPDVKEGDDIVVRIQNGQVDIRTPDVSDGKVVVDFHNAHFAMMIKDVPVLVIRKATTTQPTTPSTENTIVSTTDSTVSVTDATNVLPAGTTMNTEKVASGATYEAAVAAVASKVESKEKVAVYEINLEAAGVELHQLAGKVKVTVDVPFVISEGKTIKVYRLEGTELIPCNTTVANGKVTFETDHFSTYVFVEESVDNGSIYYIAQANGVNPYASGAADATVAAVTSPKTGDTNVALFVAMFAVATASVVVVRRRVAR